MASADRQDMPHGHLMFAPAFADTSIAALADRLGDHLRTPGELIAAAVREKDEFYAWFRRIQGAAGGRLGAHA